MHFHTVYFGSRRFYLSEDALAVFGLQPNQTICEGQLTDKQNEDLIRFIEAEIAALTLIEKSLLSVKSIPKRDLVRYKNELRESQNREQKKR